MRLRVGQSGLLGHFGRYARQFNLLELRAEQGALPRAPRLREFRAEAPEGFVFSVLSGRAMAELDPSPEGERALEFAEKVAQATGAEWFVLQTGLRVSPGRVGRERLARVAARLLAAGLRVGWEPRGPWSHEQALTFAAELGITLVRDVALEEAPPGAAVYTRVRAVGSGGRVTSGMTERLAERLFDREEAFVVVEGASAKELRRRLALELDVGELEADDDAEDEEGAEEDALDDPGESEEGA
ncbi:MAG: DUF72 domain-containing protein [Polyangiaceae bacterium]|nr:DUF72 domain-containing protein [Polyangiaceae bacterium]MCW5790978.1 DUF72 domain-containing protein [Polyangiaceae bacterium]